MHAIQAKPKKIVIFFINKQLNLFSEIMLGRIRYAIQTLLIQQNRPLPRKTRSQTKTGLQKRKRRMIRKNIMHKRT
jgi:hypothetical protein